MGWWSFRPVRLAAPPDVPGADHPVDRFIDHAAIMAGLKLSEPADRRILVRRLSLTLTGLPPTPEETAAFLADTSPEAHEKLVDRLLDTPLRGAWRL